MMVRKDKVSMINIFDMMGPVMVGPSSSHTAGAARIGNMGRTLLGETSRHEAGRPAHPERL